MRVYAGVLTTDDMSILPGVTSRNSVVILKSGNGLDADAAYHKFGLSFSIEAPSGLAATVQSSRQVNLAWTNNSPDATSVEIDRKTGTGSYARVGVPLGPSTTQCSPGCTCQSTRSRMRVASRSSVMSEQRSAGIKWRRVVRRRSGGPDSRVMSYRR